jgi:hypothetical protein
MDRLREKISDGWVLNSIDNMLKAGVMEDGLLLSNETGLCISVCHFPPGTSKWNKIEHRMFSYISMNWRGRPLRFGSADG